MSGYGSFLTVRGLLPLLIPPLYIVIVSLAERRWGQSWSGRLTAVPTQTTTVILLVALTQGNAVAGSVSAGAILGVVSLSAFAVAYGIAATRLSWQRSVTGALAAFFLAALILAVEHGSPLVDAVGALAIVGIAVTILRRLRFAPAAGRRGRIGIPVRMALATLLVLSVAVSVPLVGPIAAGTLGVFPIITAPMTVLNHQESGAGASRRYLEGLEWGLLAGVGFFLLLALFLPAWGLAATLAVALPVLVATLLAAFLLPPRWLPSL